MKINFIAPINRTSFGYHSSYIMDYMTKNNYDVRHIPIGQNDPDQKFSIPNGMFHYDSPSIKIWHPNNLSGFVGSGKKIAWTAFELEDLTATEIHNMKYPDLMLVTSNWAKSICEKHRIVARVCPLGYDENIFVPVEVKPADNTIFFNAGKWEIRKGHDVLVKAFNAAFERDDEVTLVMMPSNPFLTPEQTRAWERMYMESKLGSKIQIIPRVSSHKDVYDIMKQVDCGVFPARAEGWNMEALEIMGCGKENIITDCTGHTEFIDGSCRIIHMEDSFEKAYDGIFFGGFSKWRSIKQDQFDEIVSHMRDVHNNRSNLKMNSSAHARALQFRWEDSFNVLEKEICSAKK